MLLHVYIKNVFQKKVERKVPVINFLSADFRFALCSWQNRNINKSQKSKNDIIYFNTLEETIRMANT